MSYGSSDGNKPNYWSSNNNLSSYSQPATTQPGSYNGYYGSMTSSGTYTPPSSNVIGSTGNMGWQTINNWKPSKGGIKRKSRRGSRKNNRKKTRRRR
jgi:hypothetical protein